MNANQRRAFAQLLINLGIGIFVTFILGPTLGPDKTHAPLFFVLWGFISAVPLWIMGIKLSR